MMFLVDTVALALVLFNVYQALRSLPTGGVYSFYEKDTMLLRTLNLTIHKASCNLLEVVEHKIK